MVVTEAEPELVVAAPLLKLPLALPEVPGPSPDTELEAGVPKVLVGWPAGVDVGVEEKRLGLVVFVAEGRPNVKPEACVVVLALTPGAGVESG